jgi:Outer membrane protein transport protein (OMPP1/FadL/TodX)
MCFREHRGRADRARSWVARWAVAAILPMTLVTRLTLASPLDDPFVGGMSFNGPTDGNLGAIYWNPAALGLAHGFQILVAGTAQVSSIGVTRTAIDPTTGLPMLGQTGASATARNFRQPFQWPPGPGSYLAISSGGDRVALGAAVYMPYLEQIKFPVSATGAEPTRYQVLSMDLRNLALVPALAIRLSDNLRIGLAPGFLFSTGSLSFAEDTALDGGKVGLASDCGGGVACGAENPAAAARYNLASGQGIENSKFSVTLGGGLYYHLHNLDLGLSYQSRPLGSTVAGVEVAGGQSSVTLPPNTLPPNQGGSALTCPGGQSSRCVFGDITYRLPDVFIGGVTWHPAPGLELTVMERWVWMHLHDRIDVRLVGPSLEAAGLPEHIVLYRGFHDVWDTRARIAYWWRERVHVGGELRVETSAVDNSGVNAAAVDGFKVEPVALVEVRVSRRFWLGAGYGLTIMPAVTVTNSVFQPTAATACADSGGDLNLKACAARNAGEARPTAAGTYTSFVQDFGLTFNARF